jgi:hypothetical protein
MAANIKKHVEELFHNWLSQSTWRFTA